MADFPVSVSAEDRTPFTRVLEASVRAIAIDRDPHVSALGERVVHVHDKRGWREEALPEPASSGDLELFYGRDYRVRLVGTKTGDAGLETLYYRWLPGGFRAAPDELGRLGSTRQGDFVALLGTADPEVVCRPGDVCLIKRLSGWATVPAPPDLELVAIHEGRAWAVAGRTVLELHADKRWHAVEPQGTWARAASLWVDVGGVYVVESETQRLHHFQGGTVHVRPLPGKRPAALWSGAGGELWLGAEDGLYHRLDGSWRKVNAVAGSVQAITGRAGDDVWVGGASGLYRSAR